MSGELAIQLNGLEFRAREGETVLQALMSAGVDIPHVCYHPSLGPIQTCDTCIVEVDGKLKRACATPLSEGMKVETKSPRVMEARLEAVNRILHNHDLYCTVCENNNGDCALHEAVHMLNMDSQKYPFEKKPYEVDDSNPFYRYDPNQCILCGRCVEACQNVEVNETLSIDWSLERPRVVWDHGVPINESSCVSCGHCVTVCPVNALMEKSMLGEAGYLTSIPQDTKEKLIDFVKSLEPAIGMRPIMALSNAESALRSTQIKKTKTVCTYCGVGCSFEMWTKGRKILKVQPVPEGPANGISTCIKGKFGWDFVNSSDRLTRPLIRDGNRFREATWEEAIDRVARGLMRIKEKYGGDAIEFIASSKGTNEESYLLQKLARQVFGTNNVDNSSRFCQAPATTGLWRTVGYGGDSGSISDIYSADLILAVGTNTAESHPVIATRIKRAHKLRGQKLIVADIRKHEMAERADLFIHPRPGTDLVWLSAVTKYIIDQGWEDRKFIEERTTGFEEYRKSLEPFTLDFAERETGIPREQLIRVAEMIHEAKSVCALWAMGVTQHQMGSDTSTAISNLLLVTGNYGRPGTGAYPLRGHNNVQGTSDFGAMSAYLPGYQKVSDPEARAKFEKAWNCKIPEKGGFDNNSCLEAIEEGKIKAMYVVGEELTTTGSDTNYIKKMLSSLEFLVVQDVFFSETARFADVVLPACTSLEKEGTFVNTERRIQRIYKVMEPMGESKPDFEIIQMVARACGANWNYSHPSEVMDEVAKLAPIFAGVSYDRLEGFNSLQWPVGPDGKDTPLLYTERFNFPDGRARFYPLEYRHPLFPDDEFDLMLNNGRVLEHFHEGNETYRSPGISEKVPNSFLEISPELARERGIETGDMVRVISRWGQVRTVALVTDRVSGKELYMPMNGRGEEAINILTGRIMDPDSHTPAYKELPVRVEKIGKKGKSPLPLNNPRFYQRNPRPGVEVEKKWARKDYVPITED
ncbi:putative oxidoreductase YjgC [Thermogymnomonas acidicola]|uniref:Oxidoreductase YjgC n=1 Tax=Thermogymnomonas acidicola TaxID=399579 RepID=A0AA37BQR4_9ARCH|nr:formate dehydrogenase subunit alpha [Thermogymnomonas acidicola]GGM71000.1 putative oxidoreductase YjgC [Thermogymnomonas acidicola]